MTPNRIPLKAGTRASKLARVQTRDALDKLEACFPVCTFEDVPISSPGDRDLTTDLRVTPPDFFTRDLDEKVRSGELDCAVHSAKDIPDPVKAGLDWFWLPWSEDARDAIIMPTGRSVKDIPANARIGVSSDRREAYCRRRFPNASLNNIRGNIEQRLEQLDRGDYDMLIMAAAALVRLGLEKRITEWISLSELPPPDGQGYLGMTFRGGDERFTRLRSFFVKAVTFAAAGVGSGGTCTLDALKALRRCDTCLHDDLMGPDLLDQIPSNVECVHVGKRSGRHSMPQEEITQLVAKYARRGLRVVRLKGGDPGIFGRLAEEVEVLDSLALPYCVLPGVSSLMAATTGTGMLLTRRGVSRGFTVMTPRMQGGDIGSIGASVRAGLSTVFYMSVSITRQIAKELMDEGRSPDTPAAMVYGAGGDQAFVVSGILADIADKVEQVTTQLPGTLIIGEAAGYRYRTEWGALQGRRILLTSSQSLQDKAGGLVTDFGGIPIFRPLIKLVTTDDALQCISRIKEYDWVVLTSPSAVRCFADLLRSAGTDLRSLPKLVTCGGGTSDELRVMGLRADIEPPSNFGADGLLKTVEPLVRSGMRILRLRSDKAGAGLSEALRGRGANVEDCILYKNEPIEYDTKPEFDAVFFASASAVEVFDKQWGVEGLEKKTVVAIGKPTLAALEKRGAKVNLVGPEATVESCLTELARKYTNESLNSIMEKTS
jgi:uroporphyrinogen III methyltransferase/synthase